MKDSKPELIIILNSYNKELDGPFLSDELKVIYSYFSKIILIETQQNQAIVNIDNLFIPDNTFILNVSEGLRSNSLWAFSQVIILDFWRELLRLFKAGRLSFAHVKVLLIWMYKASSLSKILKKEIENSTRKIYLYSFWCNEYAYAIGVLKKKLPSLVAIARVHRWDVYEEVNKLNYLPLKDITYKRLDKIFSISNHAKLYIESKYSSANVYVSRLGVLKCMEMVKTSIVKPNKESLQVFSCSVISSVKNVNKIANSLSMSNIPVNWTHMGNGENFEDLKKLSYRLKEKNSNFDFHFPGYIETEKIYQLYGNASARVVFINLSSSEGIPVSIIEALAFGIPVIGAAVGGVPEIVEHDYNGILLSANPSIQEVVNNLQKINAMAEDEYQQLCRNAYNTWQTKFNAEKNYAEFAMQILSI